MSFGKSPEGSSAADHEQQMKAGQMEKEKEHRNQGD